MKILAVLTVRNEAAFLLEWLAHTRAVGVTDFLVLSNDCDDGTDAMLDHLAATGQVTHVRNDGPYDKRGIQFTALKQAEKMEVVQAADWILPLDVDEFINVHVGDNTIPALITALPDATAITLTWRLFGNAGVVRYQDKPITEQFRRCAPAVLHWPWSASMFKTLYRNDGTYGKLGVHRPRNPDPERVDHARWFDGAGRELDAQFRKKRIFSNYGQDNYTLAQLNHYPLGSIESYVMKAARGRAVHSDDLLGLDYWVERNFNTDTDNSINAVQGPKSQVLADLMADPVLADLHAQAVAWRQNRFTQLMIQEPYRALFGRLLMAGPTQLVPRKAAHFMTRFANIGRRAKSADETDPAN